MLCQVMQEAGLPKGVCNVVFGTGPKAGSSLVTHPHVALISFTGGTVTAERIIKDSAPFCKKLSLELGGKNACIVFGDADLAKCVPTAVRSSFSNQGEICLCTSRIFVHRSVYAEFVERFVQQVSQLVVGDPNDPNTAMGPLVSKEHLHKVTGYVRLAKELGAKIECGGDEPVLVKGEVRRGGTGGGRGERGGDVFKRQEKKAQRRGHITKAEPLLPPPPPLPLCPLRSAT
jgi:acyl-CoA reductase-like NAD-dependent aldehyde dehydrogenase